MRRSLGSTSRCVTVNDANNRQKFRDEGLILVSHDRRDGVNAFRELTPKYFAFKQFSRFILPGYVRLETPAAAPLVAAFRSPDARHVVVVLINPERLPLPVTLRITGDQAYQFAEHWLTDRQHQCASARWTGTLPAESVSTLIYQTP